MADSPKFNVVNPRRRGRGRGRGRVRARGEERLSQDIQLATVPSESMQPQGHGRQIQYLDLATTSTAIQPRPGQASRDVTVNDKLTAAVVTTPEQGKVRQLHGKSIVKQFPFCHFMHASRQHLVYYNCELCVIGCHSCYTQFPDKMISPL